METVSRLRTAIINALGNNARFGYGEYELFDEIMQKKTCLLNLFDVGPRSQYEQREIESGKAVIHNKTLVINAEFARQVLFLSQQLDCSERSIAELLHSITIQNPNIGGAALLEAAIVEFHQRRRHIVDSLRYILEAAEASEAPGAPPVYARLDTFTRQQLLTVQTGGTIALTGKIFKEIDSLSEIITRTQLAKQNAGSSTLGPSNQAGSLGYDILDARLSSLKYERRYLVMCFYLIARLGYLTSLDIKKAIDWLFANTNHAMTYYVLISVLAIFDSVNPETVGAQLRRKIVLDLDLMTFMKKKFATSTEWKESGLKGTLLLKWTLFLTEARHRDPALEHQDGFKTEELEAQVWNAVQSDTFKYLSVTVMQVQRRGNASPATSYLAGLPIPSDQEQLREVPTDDFRDAVLSSFETLVRSLIAHASSELRKIKQRQEDLVLASARSDRNRLFKSSVPQSHMSTSLQDSDKAVHPRNDIATLYAFIGLLYSSLPPERALQFWGSGSQVHSSRKTYLEYVETSAGKLPAFLQWAVWSTQPRDVDMSMALYDMLAGLAKGQQCSELAYNFMARGGGEIIPGSMLPSSTSSPSGQTLSWNVIFSTLESWVTASVNSRPGQTQGHSDLGMSSSRQWPTQTSTSHQHQSFIFTQKDVLFAQSFLRFLSIVVLYSSAVRITISGHAQFRAIPTLVSLIPLGIPLELKGAIFDTLAAFCQPGAGVQGTEICKAVWTLMERLEVINVRAGTAGPSSLLPPVKGVEVELEEVESSYKMYPATFPFLKLLATLIHTPKRLSMRNRIVDPEPILTIPENLGQPYRLPGIGPFVSFVLDNVFAKIPSREYLRPSDRWCMNDLCLCFVERCLASYDLESLANADEIQMKADSVVPLLVHPGYEIMQRLLSSTPLQASVLSYLFEGVEGFDKGYAQEEPFFQITIIRVLRIIHRVLEIQDIFLDVLIPLLSEFDSSHVVGTIHARSYFTRFDQALSYSPQYVSAVATYVTYPAYPELVLLAIKVLTLLSESSAFTNLKSLVEQSSDSERILNGLQLIMAAEVMEDVEAAEVLAEQTTGAGAPDLDGNREPLDEAIRLAALDLFIHDTEAGRPYPSLGHYLLLGGIDNDDIQDPNALGASRAAIHSILEILNCGIPRLKDRGRDIQHDVVQQMDPLFVNLPALAEKCYRVIYQLAFHPRTSEFVMRYLRTREDFFCRHLAVIPAETPVVVRQPSIEVFYSDGSRVTTTVSSFGSFLRLRSMIHDLVALELHALTNKGHHKGVTELLSILFSHDAERQEGASWEDADAVQPFHEVGQSSLRIIAFLQSLTCDWMDSLSVEPLELQFFNDVNLHSCLRTDTTGCEIVDKAALLSLLASARRSLHADGRIVTPAHFQRLTAETTYILESCAIENHRREVQYAIASAYEAWRRLLDISFVKCFSRLPQDRRESTLFDLLHVLPTILRAGSLQQSTAILLSETILTTITKLREDRNQQILLGTARGDADAGALPAERLYGILYSVLECVLNNDHLEFVRGNLYAALINYIYLVTSHDAGIMMSSRNRSSIIASEISTGALVLSDPHSSVQFDSGRKPISSLETGSLSIVKNMSDRLIAAIARDAVDGTEVWKTIAFMLLDSLVQLSRFEKHDFILLSLARHGILLNFVRSIKESDLLLQGILKPDPDDLNPLYVHETKMSFFIRMSQTRKGAERLLEAQLLPTLARCDFLDARPEADHSFMDQDSFLPSAVQRYHQLITPALQVVVGMLATLGSKHNSAAHEALQFLHGHRDTFVILLKANLDDLSLSVIEELHLIISLLATVWPAVPKSELLSTTSGFGSLHNAILALAAKCLATSLWTQNLRPQTDAEITEANASATGLNSESKFQVNVRVQERRLRMAIVTYLGTVCQFTEHEITVVLSPATASGRQDERLPVRLSPTVPTVGDIIEALYEVCQDLNDTLKQISDLAAELQSKDHIRLDKIQDMMEVSTFVRQDLDIYQRRSVISRELQRIQNEAKDASQILINTVEMLLLILWRHVDFYTGGSHAHSSLKTSASAKFLQASDSDSIRSEVEKKLSPLLHRLDTLDLNSDTFGNDWKLNHGYVEIMIRRLKDVIGSQEVFESGVNGP